MNYVSNFQIVKAEKKIYSIMVPDKGSTLFLAMVIVSAVLAIGIGVSTILTRQVREAVILEDSAAAFYARETGIDADDATEEWNHLDWDGIEPKSAYRLLEDSNVEGKSGRVRWGLGEPIVTEDPEDPGPLGEVTVYYKNDYWGDVPNIRWKFEGGNFQSMPGQGMSFHGEGWYKWTIDTEEENHLKVQFNIWHPWGFWIYDPSNTGYYYITEEDVDEGAVSIHQSNPPGEGDGTITPGTP